MSYRGKIKRYWLILERMQQRPSMADLLQHLNEHGFHLSGRTVERDIEDLRDEFGVELLYDRASNTYGIAEDLSMDLPAVLRLLERAQLLELVQGRKNGMRELHQYLHFEGLGQLRGLHHLTPLLEAIRLKRATEVTYLKFGEKKPKVHLIHPHQLREYRGRWYVLGPTDKHKRPIALGLDRIEKLKVTGARFKRNESDLHDLYDHAIGVDTQPKKAERVVLRFSSQQAPYAKALPLHWSQEIVGEDKQGLTVALHVLPNFELRQVLLGLGPMVKVMEPKHLADTLKQAHRDAAKQYR